MRLVHLTDPHLSSLDDVSFMSLRGKRMLGFQSWYRNRRHHHLRRALDQIAAGLLEHDPDLIIITGDLVHIGLASEFVQARRWLETMGSPALVRVVPGNHDCYHPESWELARANYGDYLMGDGPGDPTQPAMGFPAVERFEEVALIGACSAHPAPWWGAIGTLGSAQRTRLGEALRTTSDTFRVLAIHHPPLPNTCSKRKALTDAAQLARILERDGPQLTLHGHLHRNLTLITGYGRIYCTASASSVQDNAPASYRLFDIQADGQAWRVQTILRALSPTGALVTQDEQTYTLVAPAAQKISPPEPT